MKRTDVSRFLNRRQRVRNIVWPVILLHMLNHVISGAQPVLYPAILDEFGLSYAQLGVIRSAATFAAGFPQLFVGFLRRWVSGRVLIGVGNLVNAVMNIAVALSQGFLLFLGFTVLGGVGSSTQHPVGASIVSANTDESTKGRMLGLNQAIPSLAFAFTPVIAVALLTHVGWRSTLGILALPALLLAAVLLLFIRGSPAAEATTKDAVSWGALRAALRNRNVLAISVLRSAMAFRMGVRTFLPLYFIDGLGFTSETSSVLYAVMLFGGVAGPFFWGYLSDRVNRKPLIIGIMAASSLSYLALTAVTAIWPLAILLFVIGFLVQTVIVQSVLSDSVDRRQLDQIFGLYFTIGFTIAAVSSVLFGYIIELYGFPWGFTYIAAVTAISLVPALFIQEPRSRHPSAAPPDPGGGQGNR
jgi:FSR family fosmidomycin resistance protein-like MFS transporter